MVPPSRPYQPPQPVLPSPGPPPTYRSLFSINGVAALRHKPQSKSKQSPVPMTDVVSASPPSVDWVDTKTAAARPITAALTARVCYDDEDDQRQPLLTVQPAGGGDVSHPRVRGTFRFL